jgi:thiosulfate/3-mercaptopyruvate sulfurtransferase
MRFSVAFRSSLVGLGLAAGLALATSAAAQGAPEDSILVTPVWLEASLARPGIRIIDVGKTRDEFEAAHIPNAQFVDRRTEFVEPDSQGLANVASQSAVESVLSRLGVAADSTVVLYDSHSNRFAARLFWVLRYYGHRDIRILDGGQPAWESAGGGLTTETHSVTPTDYRVAHVEARIRADKADVQAALGKPGFAIVDARASEFYSGEAAGSRGGSPNSKKGRIPGAQNFFWADHVNEDGRFKSVAELRARYNALGVTPDDTVISYCHVGIQASTPWFVLTQLLGYPDVRLYDSSMAEWANAPDTELVADPGR